jgi:hypothetical protein
MVIHVLCELTSGFYLELHLISETGWTSDRREEVRLQLPRPNAAGVQIYEEKMMIRKPAKKNDCSLNGMSYTIHASLV